MNKHTTLTKAPSGSHLIQLIRQAVNTGELKSGDKLCGEVELAQKYSVSVYAVRNALKELKSTGVLYSIPKKGIFVNGAVDTSAGEECQQCASEETAIIFSSRSCKPRQQMLHEKIASAFGATSLVAQMKRVYQRNNYKHDLQPGDVYEYSSISSFYQENGSRFINFQKYFTDTVSYREHMIDNTGVPLYYTLPIVIYNKKILKALGFGTSIGFDDFGQQMAFFDEVTGAIACDPSYVMPGTSQNIILRFGQDHERFYKDICNKEISEKKFTEKYYDILRRITAYWRKYHICYPRHTHEHIKNFADGKTPFFFGLSANYLDFIDNDDYGAAIMYSHDNTVNGVLTVLAVNAQNPCLFDSIRLMRHFQKKEYQRDFALNGLCPLEKDMYSELPYDNAGRGFTVSNSISSDYYYIAMNIVNVELWNIVLFDKTIEDAIRDILVFSRSYMDMQLDSTILSKQRQWADYYR